jgi:zinc transporter ZupT
LVFYGDICTYDASTYLETLSSRYGFPLDSIGPFEENLAESIVVNSRIAMRKYRLFRAAVWLNIAALVTPVLAILGYTLWKRGED